MRIYFGWYIVAICALAMALSVGGSIHSFGLYVLPASEAFGLTRAQVNTGAIVINLGMAVAGPFVGRMLDRHSARRIMLLSALTFGACLAVIGISPNPWLSSLVIAVPLAVAVVGCGTLTSPAIVARWFVAHRGRAMAIATAGIPLGPVVVVPLMGLSIDFVGWRQSLVIMGIAIGALLVLLSLVVRDAPGPDDIEPGSTSVGDGEAGDVGGTSGAPLTISQLLRMPKFWTIGLGAAFAFAIVTTDIVSLVPYAQGEGFSITEAAGLMSTYGIVSLAGTFLYAWIGDRIDRLTLFAAMCLLVGAASAALLLDNGHVATHGCVALIGLAAGIISPAFLAALADNFGAASFGIATGCGSFLSTGISAVAMRIGGDIYDLTGSYRLMFLSFLFLGIVSAVLIFVTGPIARRGSAEPLQATV